MSLRRRSALPALALLLATGLPASLCAAASRAAPADGGSLVIALLPERNVFEQKKRYQPIQDYLSRQLGASVQFKLLDNYQQIFGELQDHHVDGAFFGSMNGAIAQLRGGVEFLARPVDLTGVSTYSGYVFGKRGGPITHDPRTWASKRMAFVNKATTAGYLFPLSLLRRAGIKAEPERYFSQVTYTGSHDAAILAVLRGQADLGACKNTIFEEYARQHPEARQQIEILVESEQVPSNALGLRPDVPVALRERLRAALLGMHEGAEGQRALRQFQAQRWVATGEKDYAPVLSMAKQAGIDLGKWPLREMH